MRHARTISTTAIACAAFAPAAVALAQQVDRAAGLRALNIAYNSGEGDEGGFAGTAVDEEQCAVAGNALRCVVTRVEGATDLDTGASSHRAAPLDFGVATFDGGGRITTSREPFAEPVAPLEARVSIASRQRQTRIGNLVLTVSAAVPTTVSVVTVVDVKRRGLEFRDGVRSSRTVELPAGGPTTVSAKLSSGQKARLTRELRRRTSVPAVIEVTVRGDVGPAEATYLRYQPLRVARRN